MNQTQSSLGLSRRLLLPLLAFWPVWIWYFRRTVDGSAEPWQLLALVGLLFFLPPRRELREEPPVLTASFVVLLYILSYSFIPPLGRAGLAFLALFLASHSSKHFVPARLLLLLLSLPVFSTLDFLLSYPLRQLTARLSLPLFQSAGFEVTLSGNSFLWNNTSVLIDSPCSGVRMLYTTFLLTAFLCGFSRLSFSKSALLCLLASVLLLFGNVLRSTALFILESKPFAGDLFSQYEKVLHSGIGLVVFTLVGALLTVCAQRLSTYGTSTTPPSRDERTEGKRKGQAVLFSSLCLLASGIPFLSGVGEKSTAPPIKVPAMAQKIILQQGLEAQSLEAMDRRFSKDFPGSIARFRNSKTELLVRSVSRATRSLHPSSDCFKGSGYNIHPLHSQMDEEGNVWSCFHAERINRKLEVCEHVLSADSLNHWSDIQSWFWSATLRSSPGPWTALTRIRLFSEDNQLQAKLHQDFTQPSS